MKRKLKVFTVVLGLIISLISVTVALANESGQNVSPPPDDSANVGLTPFEQAEREKLSNQAVIQSEESVSAEILEERKKIEEDLEEIREKMLFTKEKESDGSVYWPSKAYTGLNLVLENKLGTDKFSKFVFTGDDSGKLMMRTNAKEDLLSAVRIAFSRTPELNALEVETTSQMFKVTRGSLQKEVADITDSVGIERFDSIFEEIDTSKY